MVKSNLCGTSNVMITGLGLGHTQLFKAAETGKLSVVRRILENKITDVNAKRYAHASDLIFIDIGTKSRACAWIWCVINGHYSTDNWTSLHFAARKGHLPIVNFLLKNHADLVRIPFACPIRSSLK